MAGLDLREWFQSKRERTQLKEASRDAVMKSFKKVMETTKKEGRKGDKRREIKREIKAISKKQQHRNKEHREQSMAKKELRRK